MIENIEKAIQSSGIGLTPANDGKTIRLPVPTLTEDRRKELVKLAKRWQRTHALPLEISDAI